MRWLRFSFLIAVVLSTSGYRFRCYWMCTDQTSTQNDYIEQRDRCREYAQLKLDMAMRGSQEVLDDKVRKEKLVSLFSECMGKNGWSVPAGKDETKKAESPAPPLAGGVGAAAATPSPAAEAMARAEAKSAIARSAECNFARQSASVSGIAAARAKACDLECADRLQAAPEAPRPAACPSEPAADLSKGTEK